MILAQIGAANRILLVTTAVEDEVAQAYLARGWVELTAEQHAAFQAAGSSARLDGETVVAVAPEIPLALAQEQASSRVDDLAERARLRFLTPGAGQAMEYQKTAEDAARAQLALAADPNAVLDPADYPWLGAEQRALAAMGQNASLAEVMQMVLDQQLAWAVAGADIKERRRLGKMQIAAATAAEEALAIPDGIVWPTPEGVPLERFPIPPPPPPPV